jgi:hypothetical protein
MEVKIASFNPDRQRLEVIVGGHGDNLQIDFVGSRAFMLRRVFEVGTEIVMEAQDDRVIFRKATKAPARPERKPKKGAFRDHLDRVKA